MSEPLPGGKAHSISVIAGCPNPWRPQVSIARQRFAIQVASRRRLRQHQHQRLVLFGVVVVVVIKTRAEIYDSVRIQLQFGLSVCLSYCLSVLALEVSWGCCYFCCYCCCSYCCSLAGSENDVIILHMAVATVRLPAAYKIIDFVCTSLTQINSALTQKHSRTHTHSHSLCVCLALPLSQRKL